MIFIFPLLLLAYLAIFNFFLASKQNSIIIKYFPVYQFNPYHVSTYTIMIQEVIQPFQQINQDYFRIQLKQQHHLQIFSKYSCKPKKCGSFFRLFGVLSKNSYQNQFMEKCNHIQTIKESTIKPNKWYKQQKNQILASQKFNSKTGKMSSSDFEDFQHAEAVSSQTKPVQAGSIKKGSYCMLKGHPCKVIQITFAKPGKHGSAKANIVGLGIMNGKKYEDAFPTSHTVYIPIVNKTQYEVADINEDNIVSLLLPDFSLKQDLVLPTDFKEDLGQMWEKNNEDSQVYFTVISACGEEKIIAGRVKQTAANA